MAASDVPRDPQTAGEIQELAERLPAHSPVECLCCSERWESGERYVDEGLVELRAEWERLQEAGSEDEEPLRFALWWLARNTRSLVPDDGFELVTTCPECRLQQAKRESSEWVSSNAPPQR